MSVVAVRRWAAPRRGPLSPHPRQGHPPALPTPWRGLLSETQRTRAAARAAPSPQYPQPCAKGIFPRRGGRRPRRRRRGRRAGEETRGCGSRGRPLPSSLAAPPPALRSRPGLRAARGPPRGRGLAAQNDPIWRRPRRARPYAPYAPAAQPGRAPGSCGLASRAGPEKRRRAASEGVAAAGSAGNLGPGGRGAGAEPKPRVPVLRRCSGRSRLGLPSRPRRHHLLGPGMAGPVKQAALSFPQVCESVRGSPPLTSHHPPPQIRQ